NLEGCGACRNQRDKLDRALGMFRDYWAAGATDASALAPRASLQFAERLSLAASTQSKPSLIQRWAGTLRWQFAERRISGAVATACLLLVAALGLILLRAE